MPCISLFRYESCPGAVKLSAPWTSHEMSSLCQTGAISPRQWKCRYATTVKNQTFTGFELACFCSTTSFRSHYLHYSLYLRLFSKKLKITMWYIYIYIFPMSYQSSVAWILLARSKVYVGCKKSTVFFYFSSKICIY